MKVLIATDGSDFSDAAITECCRNLRAGKNLQFRIVSVVEPPASTYEGPFVLSAEYCQTLEAEGCKRAEFFVTSAESIIRKYLADSKFKVTNCICVGSPTQMIVEEAEEWNADLIVMGSHGYGFWHRALLGSVTNAVMHHAPCSVLIIRKNGSIKS